MEQKNQPGPKYSDYPKWGVCFLDLFGYATKAKHHTGTVFSSMTGQVVASLLRQKVPSRSSKPCSNSGTETTSEAAD